MRAVILGIIVLASAMETSARSFSENEVWGDLVARAYRAVVYTNGSFDLKLKDGRKRRVSFIQRPNYSQRFPKVKLMDAKVSETDDKKGISFTFKYFWNEGFVEEKLNFRDGSISGNYRYLPGKKKDIRRFTVVFKGFMENPETKIIALRREEKLGELDLLNYWGKERRGYRMTSLRTEALHYVDIVSLGNSWLRAGPKREIHLINNGVYPRWDKPVYQLGETYEVGFLILINQTNGDVIKDGVLRFESNCK